MNEHMNSRCFTGEHGSTKVEEEEEEKSEQETEVEGEDEEEITNLLLPQRKANIDLAHDNNDEHEENIKKAERAVKIQRLEMQFSCL